MSWHYKIFCVNVNYGIQNEFRSLHLHKIMDSAMKRLSVLLPTLGYSMPPLLI